MFVKAKQGTKCPREGNPREYIDDTGAEVPETSYYLRLINDGSLIRSAVASPPAGEVGEGGPAPDAKSAIRNTKSAIKEGGNKS